MTAASARAALIELASDWRKRCGDRYSPGAGVMLECARELDETTVTHLSNQRPDVDVTALNLAYAALIEAPTGCPYHGTNYHAAGTWMGKPRCDSCKQPERVAAALAAIRATLGIEATT